MADIEEHVVIRRPVEEVFGYTTAAGNWPKWMSFILQAEQTSADPLGVGTTFRGKSRLLGLRLGWIATATEYQPNSRWAKTITGAGVSFREQLTYDPVEGGTRYSITWVVDAAGVRKVLVPLLLRQLRRETRLGLDNLKSIMEAKLSVA